LATTINAHNFERIDEEEDKNPGGSGGDQTYDDFGSGGENDPDKMRGVGEGG
jgi:hypothetical protein